MASTSDVIIIGAGIVGLCTALQIARRSQLQVVVLERAASLGAGSSGASSAVCRFRYTHSEIVQLARDGIRAYQHWPEFLNMQNPQAEYQTGGVLWFGDNSEACPSRDVDRLKSLGIHAQALNDQEVTEMFPSLNPCTADHDLSAQPPTPCQLGARHLFEADGGHMQPQEALLDLLDACRTAGITIHLNQAVDAIEVEADRVTGVRTADGRLHSAPRVINTSGPWCNPILASAGLEEKWRLRPVRIQMAFLPRPQEVRGRIPVCVDTRAGIYFRTENRGQQLLVGSTLGEDERDEVSDPDNFNTLSDDDFIRAKIHALQHRIPGLQVQGKPGGYCGLYTVNQIDMHPVVGATPVEGLLVANGLSGHGFKLAPALGALLAAAVTGQSGEFDTACPAEFLAWDRDPIPLATHNVLA